MPEVNYYVRCEPICYLEHISPLDFNPTYVVPIPSPASISTLPLRSTLLFLVIAKMFTVNIWFSGGNLRNMGETGCFTEIVRFNSPRRGTTHTKKFMLLW